MEDHAGGGLEVVLGLAVEIGVEVIHFGAQREAGIATVADSSARGDRKWPQGSKRAAFADTLPNPADNDSRRDRQKRIWVLREL